MDEKTHTVFRVKDWEERFESAKSRTYKLKGQTYMPNKQGLGYLKMMRRKDGAALYGAWCAMIGLLSRQQGPRHGYLTDTGQVHGTPLTDTDLEMLILIPKKIIRDMLIFCSSQDIAWLVVATVKDTAGIPDGPSKDTAGIPDGPSPLPLPLPLPLPYNSTRSADAERYILPEWLSKAEGFTQDLWGAWMDTRRKKRASNTPHAIGLLVRKLEQRKRDAVKAIQTAVEAGWTGFEWEWFDKRRGPSASKSSNLPELT